MDFSGGHNNWLAKLMALIAMKAMVNMTLVPIAIGSHDRAGLCCADADGVLEAAADAQDFQRPAPRPTNRGIS